MGYPRETLTVFKKQILLYTLPTGQDVPTLETLTIDTGGATVSSDTLNLASALTRKIPIGTALEFDNSGSPLLLHVKESAESGSSTIKIVEGQNQTLQTALADGSVATTYGMSKVIGANSSGIQTNDSAVDTSSYEDGIWETDEVVRTRWSCGISGSYRIGDETFDDIIEPSAFPDQEDTRKPFLWMQQIRADGKVRYGRCQIRDYQESDAINNVAQFSFTLMGQGACYPGQIDNIAFNALDGASSATIQLPHAS